MKTLAQMDPRMMMRRLVTAFIAIPRHLDTTPEPAYVFYNVRRQSNPAMPKGHDLVCLCRGVMGAAIATKDVTVIERTQVEIVAYFDEMLSQALAESPLIHQLAFEEVATDAIEETAEALSAIGKAGICRGSTETELALREAGEAIVSLERFREGVGRIPRRSLSLAR